MGLHANTGFRLECFNFGSAALEKTVELVDGIGRVRIIQHVVGSYLNKYMKSGLNVI